MKFRSAVMTIFTLLLLMLLCIAPASSMDDPGFTIKRMVVCEKIEDREPVMVGESFSATLEQVYCFLEAVEIEQETVISFVWYFEDKEMARVSLPLEKGNSWRTYASKKLGGLKGNWKVELQESSGIVLHSVSFQSQ